MIRHILLLTPILWRSEGVEISGCCEPGQPLSVVTNSCQDNNQAPSDSDTNKTHFTPKIFSLQAESFVDEKIEFSGPPGIPQCGHGKVLESVVIRKGQEEDWVILADDTTLFVTADTSEHSEFCVAETGAGLAAVFCGLDTSQHQGGDTDSVILALCCPQHFIVQVTQIGHPV